MIDEYQDTNRTPYDLMRLLTERTRTSAWWATKTSRSTAGAAPISGTFSTSSAIIRTPRSSGWSRITARRKNILEAASAVVANNKARKGKKLWTDRARASDRAVRGARRAKTKRCSSPTRSRSFSRRIPDDRVAVLYRTNSQSRQIEEALRRYGRKYIVVGGFSFYQRAEIKDMLAYLKWLQSRHDSISLLRIINTPARGIGKTTVEQIEQFALEQQLSAVERIGRMLDEQRLSGTRRSRALGLPADDRRTAREACENAAARPDAAR